MVDSGIQIHHHWTPNRVQTRLIYYARNQQLCRREKSARHGQFEEKEKTPTTDWKSFLSNFFF